MNFLLDMLRGAVIGVANVIPGVSGGTMAVVMNVYDKLIGAVSRFRRDWKKNLLILFPIVLGAGIGILLFSSLIKFLLDRYPMAVNFFFMGLIVGSIPMIFKKATSGKFKPSYMIPFLLCLALMTGLAFLNVSEDANSLTRALTFTNFFQFFFVSILAAFSMILPGISGSMIMLLFGTYNSVIVAISELNIMLLIPVALGCLIGLLGGAKLVDILMTRFPQVTFWAILGLVIGSLFSVFRESGFVWGTQGIIAILFLLIGAILAAFFGSEFLQRKINARKQAKS